MTVLYFSDRDVRAKLFDAVSGSQRPLLVSGVRHGKGMKAPQQREPYVSLERELGHLVDQVIVADDGTVEGMWRDPLGDLGDAMYPDDRGRAYLAASGYVLIHGHRPLGVMRKHGGPLDDRYFLQELLASHLSEVPAPDPARRPGAARAKASSTRAGPPPGRARRIEDEDTNPRARPLPKPPAERDAWAVLGIPRGSSKDEAKRAFRALIAGYHPDKVAHLAPEFRELAERRTREILAAWEQVEEEL